MHHCDCLDLAGRLWPLLRAKHLLAWTPDACQIVSPLLLFEVIGPPCVVALPYDILNTLAINPGIVNLENIEVRKSWSSHSSRALAQWLGRIRTIKASSAKPQAWRVRETELEKKEVLASPRNVSVRLDLQKKSLLYQDSYLGKYIIDAFFGLITC